jgi:hypothetical protein
MIKERWARIHADSLDGAPAAPRDATAAQPAE